jgi:peptide chain release factor 1
MMTQLEKIEKRYAELEEKMAQPEVATNLSELQTLAQERASIEDVVKLYRKYKKALKELEDVRSMPVTDDEMSALVKQETESLEGKLDELDGELRKALLPKDPNDQKDIIIEIRAGTGGTEAAIFAADLYRMYSRYAQSQGWKTDILSMSESGIGGFKEIIFEVRGKGAYSRLKYESSACRSPRPPAGYIHRRLRWRSCLKRRR